MVVERYCYPRTSREIADEAARQEELRLRAEKAQKERIDKRAARVTSFAAQLAILVVGDPSLPQSVQSRMAEADIEEPMQPSQVTDLLSAEEAALLPDMQFVVDGILDVAAQDARLAAGAAGMRAIEVSRRMIPGRAR